MVHSNSPRQKNLVRPAAVAGFFYPDDPSELGTTVEQLLNNVDRPGKPAKALIVPHAGYIYSGPTAARAYAGLRQLRDKIRRVVLLGPAHRVHTQGIALSSATHFATPLGNIATDIDAQEQIKRFNYVHFNDAAHLREHSIEVHLPFLQVVIDDFILTPLIVGNTEPIQVANVLRALWGDQRTLIVISSDLSHYYDYDTAGQIDNETCELISDFDFNAIDSKRACGCMPMRGLLLLAKQKNMNIDLLDLCNSGDTAGDRDRVVGYGAFALNEPEPPLDPKTIRCLFQLARKSIRSGLNGDGPHKPVSSEYPPELNAIHAVFVTLYADGALRGCVGNTEATTTLMTAVANNAYAAAFSDPRFKPLTQDQYHTISISLSILAEKAMLEFNDEDDLLAQLQPGEDGLIIEGGGKTATFLPVVWNSLPDPKVFFEELKRKAQIDKSEQIDHAWRYKTRHYAE